MGKIYDEDLNEWVEEYKSKFDFVVDVCLGVTVIVGSIAFWVWVFRTSINFLIP